MADVSPNEEVVNPVMSMRMVSHADQAQVAAGGSTAAALLRGPFLSPRRPRISRVCHIRISSISLSKAISKTYRHVCISARIRGEKFKSALISGAVPVPETAVKIPVDLWFSISYVHRLKGPTNILQLSIHRCKEDGRNLRLYCKVDLPLDQIMQMPRGKNSPIQLFLNKVSIAAFLEATIWTTRPENGPVRFDPDNAANTVLDPGQNAIDADNDDVSTASGSSEDSGSCNIYHDQPSDLIETRLASKHGANAFLRIRPSFYSKIKLVRQSGSRMFDRLRNNLRRKSFSTSDEDNNSEDKRYRPSDDFRTNDFSVNSLPGDFTNPPQDDDSELYVTAYADIATQIANLSSYFASDPAQPINTVILVDRNARQSRQILEWSGRASVKSVLSAQRLLFFGSCHEAETLFAGITTSFKEKCQSTASPGDRLRIGIAGDDASISMILRPFVQLMSREPRSWLGLRFYVIPLNYSVASASDHTVSERISLTDPQYLALFRSTLWESALDGRTALIEPVARQVEESISRYMLKADAMIRLPIAEAILEIEDCDDPQISGVGVSIPVIRDFSIIEPEDFTEPPPPHQQFQQAMGSMFPGVRQPKTVVIEYWAQDKKTGKVDKFIVKTGVSSLRVVRLDLAAGLAAFDTGSDDPGAVSIIQDPDLSSPDPVQISQQAAVSSSFPTLTDESLFMVIRMLPKDKNKFLQRLGAYSPKRSGPHTHPNERSEVITKFVCSAPPDTKFTACIDGLAIPSCKFASLTPLWPTRTKSFPIAIFKS
uniref:Uncharacterized protein n=1 Tax=Spongospora subterranea TaxID=70186 RepID=A0A0H5QTV2_9EUKA|eukprot:CRZ05162.1 hypothetical protein [Spongospora subterranea]